MYRPPPNTYSVFPRMALNRQVSLYKYNSCLPTTHTTHTHSALVPALVEFAQEMCPVCNSLPKLMERRESLSVMLTEIRLERV